LGFIAKKYVPLCVPLYKLPARSTITKNLNVAAFSLSNIQKEEIKAAKHITITSDLWTEPCNSRSFLGTTLHYFHEHEFRSARIGVIPMDCAHTGANISAKFEELLKTWGVDKNKVSAIVTDHGVMCQCWFILPYEIIFNNKQFR
jgi:hypothetical protein